MIFNNEKLAVKTTLIPLDVTHQVLATKDVQNLLHFGPSTPDSSIPEAPSTLRIMFVELLNFFAETYASVFGITAGPPLHDPLAVAVILDGLAEHDVRFFYSESNGEREERYQVDVLTEGTHEQAVKGETQTGRTVVKLLEPGQEGIKIPRGLHVEKFWKILEQCLEKADQENIRKNTAY